MIYQTLRAPQDFTTAFSAEDVSRCSLPEEKGQFIFIDDCYLDFIDSRKFEVFYIKLICVELVGL